MKAYITHILPTYPDSVRLQWRLAEVSQSGVFHFDVERSGSPNGPWTTIAADLADTYLYTDPLDQESANILSLSRDIYYRIKVTPPSGTGTIYSKIVNLDEHAETEVIGPNPVMGYQVLDPGQLEHPPYTGATIQPADAQLVRRRLLRRKIMRDEYIRLKRLVGSEFLLLKRRHFGTRCPVCFDQSTGEVLQSRCASCYGTSWVNGYFTPILVLGAPQESIVQSDISPQTKDDILHFRIQFLDFPRMDEGDIIVERVHNHRYMVESVYSTTIKTIMVHQTVTVTELGRQAIEYAIPVTPYTL